MAVRSSVNQSVQLGPEATPGTGVPATKLLTAFTWTFGPKPTTKQFVGTGRKYPGASELLTDSSAGKVAGPGDFNQLPYIVASVFGKATPALHSPSTTAYDWIFNPALSGAYSPQTYTAENGDSTEAEKYTYLLFPGWGYSFTRKQEIQITGDFFAQQMQTGITRTASPTEVARQPMKGAQANIYLDSTSAGIGTTQLLAPLNVSFAASDYYEQFWPINRANASYGGHVDKLPKNELKIKLEADTAGIAIKGSYLETGALCYVRVDVQGPMIDVANSVHATMTHDMACFVSDVSELSDSDGVYAVEYTFTVAEDSAWNTGTAQKLTFTNLIQTL